MTETRNRLTPEEAWVILQKERSGLLLESTISISRRATTSASSAIPRSTGHKISSSPLRVASL